MGRIESNIEKHYRLYFCVLMLCGAGIYTSMLFGTDVWFDEAYTYGMLRNGFFDICRITAADVHPPLYYILLKLFTMPFPDAFLASKIFSLIPLLIIMLIGGIQLEKLFDKKVSLCYMGMFLLFPFIMPYAVEVRMYSLAAMFTFITSIYAYKSYFGGSRKDLIIMTLAGAAAAYTHYFALVVVCVIYLILLIAIWRYQRDGMLKKWILCAAASVVLYLPWMGCFISQLAFKVQNEYWIDPININTIIGYISDVFEVGNAGFLMYFMEMLFLMLLLNVIFSQKGKTRTTALLSVAVWAGTIFLGVLVSIAVRPIFVIRYIVPAMPLFMVFAAVGMANLRPGEFLGMGLAIVLATGISHYTYLLGKEYNTSDRLLSDSFTEKYRYCDSYIIGDADDDAKMLHFMGVLAYYEIDKNIYSYKSLTPAMPFINCRDMSEFDSEDNKNVILLVSRGDRFPEDLLEEYRYIRVGKVSTDTANNLVDVYLLMRKERL